MLITDRPGMDCERMVASPVAPLTAFSIGLVTSCFDLLGGEARRLGLDVDRRGHEVGKHVQRRAWVAHSPASSAIRVKVAMAPA